MTRKKRNPGRVAFVAACLLIFVSGNRVSGNRAQAQAAQDLSAFQGTVRAEPYRNPIIFTRTELDEKTGKPLGAAKVWVMEEDGSGLRQLTYGTNYNDHPALFSDRTHGLYSEFRGDTFDRKAGARLVKINVYSGEQEVFAEAAGCSLHHVALTAKDDQIAYQHDCGNRRSQRIGRGADEYEINMRAVNPVILEDSLIFMHQKDPIASPGRASLVRLYGHGRGAKAVFLTDDQHLNRRPVGAPDGEWIAWQTDAAGNEEIFLSRTDGSQARNLTNAPSNEGHPWFSRDGKWIVFESDRTGADELWKINLETSQQQQLTFGGKKYSSREPRW